MAKPTERDDRIPNNQEDRIHNDRMVGTKLEKSLGADSLAAAVAHHNALKQIDASKATAPAAPSPTSQPPKKSK